jgi:uncharacterized protein
MHASWQEKGVHSSTFRFAGEKLFSKISQASDSNSNVRGAGTIMIEIASTGMPESPANAEEGRTSAARIDEMVHRLVERFNPDQIILFGSHARGTARPDSDVDLLVVMPVTGSKREKQIELRCALHDIHIAKDIIVATPEEVERRRNIVGTLVRIALREGKVLYARGQ